METCFFPATALFFTLNSRHQERCGQELHALPTHSVLSMMQQPLTYTKCYSRVSNPHVLLQLQ